MPRPDGFGDLDQHLHYFKADLIIAAYGYNESFAGKEGLPDFKKRLDKFLTHLKSHAYNGKTAPKIVLLSPIADSNLHVCPAGRKNNDNLQLYTSAIQTSAQKHDIAYIDTFTPRKNLGSVNHLQLTNDGHSQTVLGHTGFASETFQSLFHQRPPEINEPLRQLVLDKNRQFERRYRPLNTFYYTGGRKGSYGYLDFLPAMRNFDLMCENRDKAIHATAATGKLVKPDDSNLPELDQIVQARGANKFLSPADELKAFKIDPRFEVNCFASEEDFPELACPIAMRWDGQHRLWVSCSTTYPHIYPGQEPNDKIIILEDTDWDGKADKCTTWADDLHIPLSFVLDGNGGVFCSEQPHLTHLTDQDGDGKMDTRDIVLTGFGCEDSHHSLHDFIWTPGGDLLFRESIFHHSQIETAYGPVRTKNSSWFLYNPTQKKLTAFGSYPNTNPWGVTFDKWGNHVASHPVFASTFHATNPAYPRARELDFQSSPQNPPVRKNNSQKRTGFDQQTGQHPKATGMQAYSGVCGHEFVDFPQWPEEMQGGFIKVRYKPTNNVEFHTWTEKEDHFAEEKKFNLIFSSNLSFIPVDFKFGPRGAAYICDWYNPVKGHAQYSLRDPRRDRKAGRIWRVIPKNFKPSPLAKITGAAPYELLENLRSPQYSIRYRSKREFLGQMRHQLSPADPRAQTTGVTPDYEQRVTEIKRITSNESHDLHKLEALWLYQTLEISPNSYAPDDAPHHTLLQQLINSKDHLVAASAFGPLRFWHDQIPAEKTLALLKHGATHPSQHVRREAVLCASYLNEGGTGVPPVKDVHPSRLSPFSTSSRWHPPRLRHSQSSFNSEGSQTPFWQSLTRPNV